MRRDHLQPLGDRQARRCRPARGRPTAPWRPAPRRCARRRRRGRRCRRWRSRSSRRRGHSRRRRASRVMSMAATSEPERGSDSAKAAIALPGARPRRATRCCSGVPNRLIAPGAEPLHGEGEVGQPVVPRQRLAGEAERAHVERRGIGRVDRRRLQPAVAPEHRHQLAAGRVDVVMRRPAGSPRTTPRALSASSRWRASKNGQARKVRSAISCPRTPAVSLATKAW